MALNLNGNDEKKNTYICLNCQDTDCSAQQVSLCKDAVQCWTSITRSVDGRVKMSRGCTPTDEQVSYCRPRSNSTYHFQKSLSSLNITCCKGNYCNNGSFPTLPLTDKEIRASNDVVKVFGFISIFILSFLFMAVIFIKCKRKTHHKKILASRSLSFDLDTYSGDDIIRATAAVGDNTLKEYLEQSITSGSGYGLPLLMQRSLAKNISLMDLIGKGKYGEVWRGIWNGESVAVKIFLSKDEASWSRETEIYNTIAIRHSNILTYFASDMTSRNSTTQLLLITEYHRFGSLYDYLNNYVLNYSDLFKICCSIATGVNHLHKEIYGANFVQSKPAIAHRDIKSKNILVKDNGECVMADFGLAVTYYQKTDIMNIASNPRVGTKRYMAPEILDEVMNMNSFESFKRTDIYALGLVLWEICRRTTSISIAEEYKPPFSDCVGPDPSFDEMRKVVCIDQRRPVIPNRWISDPILSLLVNLIKECWHHKPSVRPTALRVLKTMNKVKEHL